MERELSGEWKRIINAMAMYIGQALQTVQSVTCWWHEIVDAHFQISKDLRKRWAKCGGRDTRKFGKRADEMHMGSKQL